MDLPPEAAIVAHAADPDVVLVVIALHRVPIGANEAGHSALAVFAQIPKPVLVVPPSHPVRESVRRVVVPLDGTRAVTARMTTTIRALASAGLDVIVLHVFDARTVPRFLDSGQDLQMWAEEFVARHLPGIDVRLEVRSGDVVAAAVEVASGEDADIIALAWRQDVTTEQGRVLKRLLGEARRPVLLIPVPPAED